MHKKDKVPKKPYIVYFFVSRERSRRERLTVDMGGDKPQGRLFQPCTPGGRHQRPELLPFGRFCLPFSNCFQLRHFML